MLFKSSLIFKMNSCITVWCVCLPSLQFYNERFSLHSELFHFNPILKDIAKENSFLHVFLAFNNHKMYEMKNPKSVWSCVVKFSIVVEITLIFPLARKGAKQKNWKKFFKNDCGVNGTASVGKRNVARFRRRRFFIQNFTRHFHQNNFSIFSFAASLSSLFL